MEFLGDTSSLTDPDMWHRKATKSDGYKYYDYVMIYMDNLLVVSDNPEDIILE